VSDTTAFTAGQQVRLTSVYHARPFVNWLTMGLQKDNPVHTLAMGTVFTVPAIRRRKPDGRLDGPTVIVDYAGKRWCIPTRLLEAVPSDNGLSTTKPTESDRDAESDRVR
jgi:hypothetical protein